jgi:membrane-bound metal-dependent hydrolase YbcI (DUF457 family)
LFLGHFGVALGAKEAAPKVSLGTMVLAAQFVDLLWPFFLILGIEHVRIAPGNTVVTPLDFYDYPFTHSLLSALCWSLVLGLAYYFVRRRSRASVVIALCVFSHWILDLITHRPDLPLGLAGSVYFGLGLWNSIAGTLIAESVLFLAGVVLYTRATEARDKVGTYSFLAFVVLLAILYLLNLFGPPPPDERSIAILGNGGWLFVLWAYWIDRHRTARLKPSPVQA